MAEFPALRTDGQNWPMWRTNLEAALNELGISAYISQTTPNPYNKQVNALAKCTIASTIPDSNVFKKPTTTTAVQYELQSDKYKQEAAYRLETATDVCDMSRCDNGVSNGSGRRNNNVPSNKPHRQHQRELKCQGRVKRGRGEGEEEGKSKGRKDKKAAIATGPGKGATDQKASSVSLVKPTSSLDSPRARVDTPPSPPLPPPTPNLPVEQTAPTSTWPTHQQSRNGHVPGNRTRRTCEDDVKGSQGKVESRSRGDREPDDEDGDDMDVDHTHVMPHPPSSTCQTANEEATGTSNPNLNSAGTTMPVGHFSQPLSEAY
ncbi:hypothetical protein PAXINDRAFT_17664 [Paxillus involutus ATCC 200175]|uniref:Uncharacterized protein n=1 Tax=Paxillus involutus ATCC 200175 TaxID=664439 RepID=A0A0C9TN55_PAXIN|nr:hypothetical protein PAXINDRAFT_17664 [Paxillus involutus ATCC 200175]